MPRPRSKFQPQLLRGFLENYTVPILRKLGRLVASNLPTRKDEIIAIILGELENPERLKQLWGDLDTLQQAAVAEVVHSHSDRFDEAGFRAKYGSDPHWGQLSEYGGRDDRPSPLNLFIYKGVMPRDMKGRLKAFVPPPRAVEVQTVDAPPVAMAQTRYEYSRGESKRRTVDIPVTQVETERVAQHDVHAVLRLIDTGKVRASERTRRVTTAGARAITKVLHGGDFYPPEENADRWQTVPGPIKAFAWPLILQGAGLVDLSGTKLQLTQSGKKALVSPPHQVIRKAWRRWLKTRLLDEFNRVHTIKGQTGGGKRKMTAVADRRAAVVQALAACPASEWIALDEFSRFMRASGCTFEVSRDLWSLYIGDPHYGSLGYDGYGEWHVVQGRYIMAFLFEYAATLGLIDVAYIHPSDARGDYNQWGTDDLDCLSRYDGLLHIRINGLGAWCLGLTDKYEPSPLEVHQVLKVLPNMEIVETEPLLPGDTLVLEQFAEQTSDVVWKIERIKLLKALEEGHSVDDMVAFLKSKAGGQVPDTVTIFFQEISERVSSLVDRGTARLIEVQDAALAQLIINDGRLRSLCILAGEHHIVVPAEHESAFRRALRELGYGVSLAQRAG